MNEGVVVKSEGLGEDIGNNIDRSTQIWKLYKHYLFPVQYCCVSCHVVTRTHHYPDLSANILRISEQ